MAIFCTFTTMPTFLSTAGFRAGPRVGRDVFREFAVCPLLLTAFLCCLFRPQELLPSLCYPSWWGPSCSPRPFLAVSLRDLLSELTLETMVGSHVIA